MVIIVMFLLMSIIILGALNRVYLEETFRTNSTVIQCMKIVDNDTFKSLREEIWNYVSKELGEKAIINTCEIISFDESAPGKPGAFSIL